MSNYEWFLIRIKLYGLIALEDLSSPFCSWLRKISPSTSHCSLSKSPSWSSVLSLYPRYLRIKGEFSTTYSPFPVEKEAIEYWLSFSSFKTVFSPNSMGVKKYRRHPQVARGLSIPIHLSHCDQTYLRPTSFIGIFYLALISAYFRSIGDVYHHLMWWVECFRYLNSNKQQSCWIWWKCIPPGVVQTQKILASPLSHLMCRLADLLSGTYKISHVLSMFLFNTSLHVTQA